MIAEQIRQTPLEREHVAGLKTLLDGRERELDKELNEHRLKDQGAGGVPILFVKRQQPEEPVCGKEHRG